MKNAFYFMLKALFILEIFKFLSWLFCGHVEKWFVKKAKVKDTLKAFDDFKNKQKSVWSNVFWYVKVCIFWKSIQCTIHGDKTQVLKKNPSDKINSTNNALFSLVSTKSSQFYFSFAILIWTEVKRFVSLKLCVGFSIFNSVSFSLKFIFLFNKVHGLFDFKTS